MKELVMESVVNGFNHEGRLDHGGRGGSYGTKHMMDKETKVKNRYHIVSIHLHEKISLRSPSGGYFYSLGIIASVSGRC